MRATFARLFFFALLSGPLFSAAENPDIASLREKALHGNAIAQYNLGIALAQGQNTAVDLPGAYAWLALAGEQGTAGKSLENLLALLTSAQLAAGERRLTDLRAQIAGIHPASVTTPETRSGMPQFSRPLPSTVPNVTPTPLPTKAPLPSLAEKNAPAANRPGLPAPSPRNPDTPPSAQELTEIRAQLAALSEAMTKLQGDVQRLQAGVKTPGAAENPRR